MTLLSRTARSFEPMTPVFDVTEANEVYEKLTEALLGMVEQYCPNDEGVYLSGYISANAEALELLVELSRFEQVGDNCGRYFAAKPLTK